MWSGATPPEGVTAEIVNLSDADPSKIAQLDLKGKLVLVGQNPAGFKWALVKAGAIGAINAFTENPSLQDGRQWINAWGDHEDTDQDRDVENREFLPRLHAWVPRFSFHLIGEAV